MVRTEAQRYEDFRRYEAAHEHEDVFERAARDLRVAPGDLAKKFREAKSKGEPSTAMEHELVRALEAPLELGFVSNAILYGDPLRYLGVSVHTALFRLLKGGVIRLVQTHAPNSYWLVSAVAESKVAGGEGPREIEEEFVGAVKEATNEYGMPLVAPKYVRRRLPGLSKQEFDEEALRLERQGVLVLHYNDFPADLPAEQRDNAIVDGQIYYTGMALRRGAEHTQNARSRERLVLSAADVDRLPVGSLVFGDGGALVVVPAGLTQVAVLPETADGPVPGGAPAAEFAREFYLIKEGDGRVPLHRVAQRKATEWFYGHRGHEPNARRRLLDSILDQVKFREREVTIDADGYTPEQVEQIVAEAKARGLHVSGTQRWLLIGDLGSPSEHRANASYYVWIIGRDDKPLDEGPYGPKDLESAKTFARIGATEGEHDRVVSLGRDPGARSFEVVRRYQARTGERIV